MDALQIARTRYTTKHYDPARRVSDEDFDALLEVLRLSPSSVNSQPWEFFIARTAQARDKIMPAILDFATQAMLLSLPSMKNSTSSTFRICLLRRPPTAATQKLKHFRDKTPDDGTSLVSTASPSRNC